MLLQKKDVIQVLMRLMTLVCCVWVLNMVIFPQASIFAQDGDGDEEHVQDLTPEQEALLERVSEAMERQRAYSSYVETSTQKQVLDLSVFSIYSLIEMAQNTATDVEIDRQSVIVDGDIQSELTVAVETSFDDLAATEPQSAIYILDAEVRRIGDELYVKAAYTDAPPELLENNMLPEGWVLTSEFEGWEDVFYDLNLSYYLGENGAETNSSALGDLDTLFDLVSDVQSEAQTLEDGTDVEMITVVLAGEGVRELLSQATNVEEENPLFDAFFGSVSQITYTFAIDEDDLLRQIGTRFAVQTDANMRDFGEQFASLIGVIKVDFSQTVTFSEINNVEAAIEPPAGFES